MYVMATIGEEVARVLGMPFELRTEAGRCVIEIRMPGVRSQDVAVRVEGRTVSVSVHVEHELAHGRQGSAVVERHTGTATRKFTLAESIDSAAAHADLVHGVLRVVLPLGTEGLPRALVLGSP
jgi:HSP20 family protein